MIDLIESVTIDLWEFKVYTNKGLDLSYKTTTHLVKTLDTSNKLNCFTECVKLSTCSMFLIKNVTCTFFTRINSISLLIDSSEYNAYYWLNADLFYEEKQKGLINYWPFDFNLNDVISSANLFGGTSYSFCEDRFKSKSFAVCLNHGYLQVPSGVYFNGDFTISIWIKANSFTWSGRILDFGNGSPFDTVLFAYSYPVSPAPSPGYPFFKITQGKTQSDDQLSSGLISLGTWNHLALTLNGTFYTFYINGTIWGTGQTVVPNPVVRKSNFIGKGYGGIINGFPEGIADAVYDELKIFNKCLVQKDIIRVSKLNYYF